LSASGNPDCTLGVVAAPKGTRLPIQPRFKGNMTARYEFDLGKANAFAASFDAPPVKLEFVSHDTRIEPAGPDCRVRDIRFLSGREDCRI